MGGRFLTPEAKRRELATWAALRALGGTGPGDPDPDAYLLCDRLNALPGVCTLQSCAGHIENGYLRSGHLWVWLDEEMAARFDARAFELSAEYPIEQVSRIYAGYGQEIASIYFAGNERGLLVESVQLITAFFERLTRYGSCQPLPSPDTDCPTRPTSAWCS